jgi:hypothetical protein
MTTNPQEVLERLHDISFAIDQVIKWNRNQKKPFPQCLPSHAKKDVPRISRVLMLLFSDHFLKDDRNALRNLTNAIQTHCADKWFVRSGGSQNS